MNMRDLSRDDDFLSHLLVEKLGTGDVPLVVHKMDPSRKVPKTDADDLLEIVRRMVVARGVQLTVIRQAVDDLLTLNGVKYYLKSSNYDQKQINAFATHASRYFELYLPNGSIEISHTSRYSHRTGKSELCILATRPLAPGTVVSELKGSMADLTEEEDKELKRTGERHAPGVGIRRDFSVIHSRQLKKNHLFLGPARFVNHDCDHNVELFREGRYITFRVLRPIAVGEELTAHYGPGYFGKKNRHCLCATCEKNGRGGYAPQGSEEDLSDTASGSEHDGPGDESSSQADDSTDESDAETINCNERRTRRGVYAVMPEAAAIELEKEADVEAASDLTSLPTSQSSVPSPPVVDHGLMTPEPEGESRGRALFKGKTRETLSAPVAPVPRKASESISSATTRFRSVISTRAQKAREASLEASSSTATSRAPSKTVTGRSVSAARQLITPPLTNDSAATSVRSSSRLRGAGDTLSSLTESSRRSTPVKDKKGKGRATTTSVSDVRDMGSHEPEARHLRPRVSAPIFDSTLSKKKLVDAPRGLDGKPLPMCSTCGNVLPVIAVDSEIVWGLSVGRTGKRGRPKKDVATDCPRCLRHFAIYGRKWPERVPGDGRTFIPIQPMFSTQAKKITASALAAVNRKLASTTAHNQKRHVEHEEDSRPAKKQKPAFMTRRPAMAQQAKQTVQEMRALKEKMDGRRSGRTRVPSLKLREREPHVPPTRVSPRRYPPSTSSLSAAPDSPDRPLALPASPTTPTGITPVSPKNITPKSLAVAAQPRDANGRFGKKASTNGRFVRKQFSVRKRFLGHTMNPRPTALKSVITTVVEDGADEDEDDEDDDENDPSSDLLAEGVEHVEFGEEALEDVVLKRSSDSSDLDESPRKRIRLSDSDASDTSPTFAPRFVMGRGSLLRPNPISFARRKWAVDDDETLGTRLSKKASSDIQQLAPAAVITTRTDSEPEEAEPQAGLDAPTRLTTVAVRTAKLTFKPSPMNFAKRRWAPSGTAEEPTSRQSSLRRDTKPSDLADSQDDEIPLQRSGSISKSFTESLKYPCEDDSDDYYTTDDEDYYSSEESDGPHPSALASTQPDARPPSLYRAPYLNYGNSESETHGYPVTRARSPIYRPASFHISRPTTPHFGRNSPVSPLTSPESTREVRPQLSRIPTPEPVGEATSDSSERLVERLLGVGSNASTSTESSATPPTPPTAVSGVLETSPGAAWKRTVLIPTDPRTDRILNLPTNVSFPIPSTDYAYDSRRQLASNARPSFNRLAAVVAMPARPYMPSPTILAPIARSPVKLTYAGWDTSSDTDSP
ncbi:SET domain-containing protein [Phanerochaete sordida]|uniref:SET domain-containing protein n=1 Tax=Phanerochaete sordida TaxID=48140 RepID=A0A9P3GGD8_9APHY|nr:SET domain-containing protein [Phanerochaete sordida]